MFTSILVIHDLLYFLAKARKKVVDIDGTPGEYMWLVKLANLLIHWTVHAYKQQNQLLCPHKKQSVSTDLLLASVENH